MVNATARTPSYFAHVDGLRAVAVLAVLLYHLTPGLLPGGFMGVDIFFVISGFVVTASLAGHRSESAGAFLAQFYSRRLARLVPALVTVLVVTTALYVLFVPRAWFNRAAETVGQTAFWGISNWTLDRHVVNYFEPGAEFNPFTHTWSLGVEEQFYLIAPLFLFVALGSHFSQRRRRLATLGIVALAVASLAACYYFGVTRGSRFVFYQLVFRFWELATGVVLYLVGRRVTALGPAAAGLYRWSGWTGLALVAAAMLLPRPEAYPYFRSTLAVLGALLLIGLPSIARQDRLNAVLRSRAAIWIGHRSYALYLWHWPIYVLARWTTGLSIWPYNLLAVLLSFAAAAVSYRVVENPVRHSPRLKRWRPAARITTFVLMLGTGWLAGRTLLANQPALGLGQPTRQAADWYMDRDLLKTTPPSARQCEPTVLSAAPGGARTRQTTFVPESCARHEETRLFVIGDSHAGAYSALLEQLSAEQGRTVMLLQALGCSYINMIEPMGADRDARCDRASQVTQQTVLKQARPGDIVFLPSLRLPRLIEAGGERRKPADSAAGRPTDIYARSPAELAGIERALQDAPRWFTPFLDAGLRVVFELPKPILRAHPFQCVDWFNRNNPDCAGGLSERRADQERYRAPVVDAIQRLVAAYPGVSAWDPLPALCDANQCNALVGGRPLFFDADHVSPYANLVLLPGFRQAIDALGGPQ
jgi:peptidoglycan/LPS O-acetylase OafA/YrhL